MPRATNLDIIDTNGIELQGHRRKQIPDSTQRNMIQDVLAKGTLEAFSAQGTKLG